MRAVANQPYPPEPPLSFPPAHNDMAHQLYPPEPPLSFPPAHEKLAAQPYPPEPPLDLPPLPTPDKSRTKTYVKPETESRAMLVMDDVDQMALSAMTGDRELRAAAQAMDVDDTLPLLNGDDDASANEINMTQLYMACGVLMMVLAALMLVLRRKGDTVKKKKGEGERTVYFSDSYEPFLG